MFEHLAQDLRRCGNTPRERVREILFSPGTWAVIGYRYRRWVYTRRLPRPVRLVLNATSVLVQVVTEVATNIQLPCSADIGPGLCIPHSGYVVVASRAVIGRHCTLTQGVTIGHGGGGSRSADYCPVIGDRVYVGPAAAVIGPITVGDDALIGVGAVVTRPVPPRGVAVGNPARVVSRAGSFQLIRYPGMNDDPDRLASLAESGRSADGSGEAEGSSSPRMIELYPDQPHQADPAPRALERLTSA
jgi:serine O-acetyltransferase